MCEDEKLTGFVKNVADAIREVEGSSDQIRPVDFPERIKNLSSSSSSGFVYNVNTVNETSVPTADLEKLKSDPNAMIIETYTIAPVNFKIYYRKMFKSGDTYDRFVSVYSTANEEHINQTTLRAYRDLNYATSTLSKKRTVNIVNEDQLAAYLRRPTDNPTKDSVVKVSSTGSTSWIAISDIKVPIIEIPAASTTITQEQANIIINNKDVTILYGTTQKIIYRKFTEYELTTTHLAYFVQFGGANPDTAQKIKQLVLTVDLNNLTVSRVELEIPRVSFITGTDEDENDVVLQTKFAKEVFDTPAVKANPTLKGTEEELTALQVGLTKYKVPSGGGSGAGIDTLTDVNLTSSGTTVAYDIASGVTVSSNGKFTYEGGEKEATTKVNVPIVAGKGIEIAKVADKEQVEVRLDKLITVNASKVEIGKEASEYTGAGSVVIGTSGYANKNNSVSIGGGEVSQEGCVSIGKGSFTYGQHSIALLGGARGLGYYYQIAIGFEARSYSSGTVAIGYQACGNDSYAIAIGYQAEAMASDIAIGHKTKVATDNTTGNIAIGKEVLINQEQALAGTILGKYGEMPADAIFALADGKDANNKHIYYKITKETVDNVAKYTAYLNNKKLLTEDEGLSKPSGNPTEDSFVKVSSTGSPSWQPVSDFLAIPTSAANSDRVCIIPDGQTKFGYKNAYKTVYNVENVFVIRDVRGTVPQPDPQREQDGVNLRYLQANYNANPALDGTEAELTGVTLNGVKYKVPSGGSFEGEYDRSIQIGKTAKAGAYSVAIGELSDSVVTLNPTGSQALAIGYQCSEKHGMGVVIGYHSQSGAQNQTIIGYSIQGTNAPAGAIIIGTYPSGIDSSDKVVLGYGSTKYFNVKFVNGSFVANVAGKQLAFLEEVKPADNPTVDSVVKISSTGTTSYLGIDTTATSASTNLITSGAVAAVEYSLSQRIAGCATEPDISTFPENDDAFFMGEKTSHASKWLPKKHMTLKSHKIHFDAFDSGSTVGQYDDAFISVLCYTETHFTVDTLTTFMLATGQSYPVCSPSYGMVGYVRVSNAAGEITWEDKEGNNIALAGINENSYVVTDIQSFFPFE